MTLVVIGPVTKDLIRIGGKENIKIGGATYFQSFVFEKFFNDYLSIINCSDKNLKYEFPSPDKVKVIEKDDTHFFINDYPNSDNLNIRRQLSNFAKIPIYKSNLEDILPDSIDAFVLNPLNRFDFPLETIDYIKSFDVPIFLSIQGFLRVPNNPVNENYTIKLSNFDKLSDVLCGINAIFLDEAEENIIGNAYDVCETVITNGSFGSRIVSGDEVNINAVKCVDVIDSTGCGDTYMAAYISYRIQNKSIYESGIFASYIASEKLKKQGPY